MGSVIHGVGLACVIAAALGSAYAVFAARLVTRRRQCGISTAVAQPGVTILKPLHGAEDGLHRNLASFIDQRYSGPIQVVFGVADEHDGAVSVVRELIERYRDRDIALVVAHTAHGANRKVSTLAALEPHIRHDVVVLADSDIGVPSDYLARIVDALAPPGVGLVTCLYRGAPSGGIWAKLASMAIDYHFLPSVLVGLRLRIAHPCFGSTIALSRETLATIGGFRRFLEHLADDYAIGEAVRELGFSTCVPDMIVTHTCPERRLRDVIVHELRWARTIRAIDPWGYAGSTIAHALPLSVLGAVFTRFTPVAVLVLLVALAARLVLARSVDHTLGAPRGRLSLLPARDLLSFAIFIASFFVRDVHWRGQRYRVRADGTLQPVGDA